jgi:hypothetical protein
MRREEEVFYQTSNKKILKIQRMSHRILHFKEFAIFLLLL